jgi:hypothetical protein
MNLRHPLLHPPDLPFQPLPTLPVLLGRSIKFPLVVGDVAGQLVPLTLKGSAFIRGCWHVTNDSAGRKGEERLAAAADAHRDLEARRTTGPLALLP